MICISKEELKSLKRINGGSLGTVYKKDNNTAYKIYHDTVKNIAGIPMTNPNLNTIKLHYQLLLQRAKRIKQSGLIKDLIYVDGSFKGVAIPFYNGISLCKTDLSLQRRIDISKELITKSKELNRHLIYPTDYKTNNILLQNGHPVLIDLDDVRTHAFIYPSPLFRMFSVAALGNTIQDLLGQYDYLFPGREIYDYLTRQKSFYSTTYTRILKYIKEKEISRTIIFIDKHTDLKRLKDNTSTYQYNIVYVLQSRDELKTILPKLKEYNIPLYDIVQDDELYKYPNIEMIKEGYYYNQEYKLILKK